MSMYGANPEQLEHLGATLRQQVAAIDALVATVSGVLAGTTWMGPARDRFEGDWTGTFRTALSRLNQAFDAAGQDCVARANDLRRVMGGV
jgi:uncharacterized protein YukE